MVPFLVDVHCAQWGTLPRLITAVGSRPGSTGVGIDENTALVVDGADALVLGAGQVWQVRENSGSVDVRPYRHGQRLTLPAAR